MKQARILMVGMPRLLTDILMPIVTSQPDMAVVGEASRDNLLAAAQRTDANVAIIKGERASIADECETFAPLLRALPHFTVLTIADDAKSGSLFELYPRCVALGEMSADALRSAIRGRMRAEPAKN